MVFKGKTIPVQNFQVLSHSEQFVHHHYELLKQLRAFVANR